MSILEMQSMSEWLKRNRKERNDKYIEKHWDSKEHIETVIDQILSWEINYEEWLSIKKTLNESFWFKAYLFLNHKNPKLKLFYDKIEELYEESQYRKSDRLNFEKYVAWLESSYLQQEWVAWSLKIIRVSKYNIFIWVPYEKYEDWVTKTKVFSDKFSHINRSKKKTLSKHILENYKMSDPLDLDPF